MVALQDSHMVVSRSKTAMLAAGMAQRAPLRTEARGRYTRWSLLVVKDLGVDESMGANRSKAALRLRAKEAAQSAMRIARVPTGWAGRTAAPLCSWFYPKVAVLLRVGRFWHHGGGIPAPPKVDVFFAVRWQRGQESSRGHPGFGLPGFFLEPKLQVFFGILWGWAKRCAIDPSSLTFVLPAWEAELQKTATLGRHGGPVFLLVHKVRELGWEQVAYGMGHGQRD